MSDTGPHRLTGAELLARADFKAPKNAAQKAIEILTSTQKLAAHSVADDPLIVVCEITPNGISQIETDLERQDSVVRKYSSGGVAAVASRLMLGETIDLSAIRAVPSHAPSNNDQWEPLALERDSISYKEAVSALQSAYEVIRQDNGFSASDPKSRDAVVSSLEVGLGQIQNGTPTKGSIAALVRAPLKFIIEKFAAGILAESAKLAFIKLAAWLPSIFT
jgi:hypothetical protein